MSDVNSRGRRGFMVNSKYLKDRSAVVTLSGGQDSSTLLWAKETFGKVVAVSFSYGQKHSIELEKAKHIARIAEVEHHILDVSLLNQLAPNALTRVDIEVPNFKLYIARLLGLL